MYDQLRGRAKAAQRMNDAWDKRAEEEIKQRREALRETQMVTTPEGGIPYPFTEKTWLVHRQRIATEMSAEILEMQALRGLHRTSLW